tara:strand:- start:736 stop:942 length:207 start_codon:yes stop_codon:yes gene_type:complete
MFIKMEEETQQIQTETGEVKKTGWLKWLIIALVVIGIGAGIYFLLGGGSGAGVGGLGGGIPSPPALPS